MEKFRGEVKRTILIIASLLFIPAFACADDTIWNRVFFGDFTNIYDNAVINPVETSLVTAGFAGATYLVMKNDAWLASLITKNRSKAADNFYDFFNNAGDGVYVLAGDAVLFAVGGERERYVAQRIVEGMAVSGIISYAGKVVFGRERPTAGNGPYEFSFFNFGDNSYPSGHTTVAFMWATIVADTYANDTHGISYLAYPVAALCGAARIYKNMHWPSDVLAGALIGVVTGKAVCLFDDRESFSFDPSINGLKFAMSF
jgi:membrane-associated phospholipid phosphatase